MKKVFVIIVTYKGKRWYDKCFQSLRQSAIPVQTIVVDNSPTNEDAEYIKTHSPEIHLIKTSENLGFGRANNLGMRYALENGCDYVFLLNQDTWIEKDSISALINVAEQYPEYGILSPIHLNGEHTEINSIIGIGKNYRNEKLLSDLYLNRLNDIYETNYVNAAAWLLPRKTLETIGGFDPIFLHYEEDDNYINRVIYHGFKIGVCPKVYITHDHHDSKLSDERLQLRKRQFWLVNWTNINVPFSVWRISRYNIRKMLYFALKRDFKRVKYMRVRLIYCIDMRKAIIYSRKENIQPKESWL